MPKPGDDKFFGGSRGSARKAFASMVKSYGRKDAEHVYNARIAKQKRRSKRI